jgi:tetratricopeptide (TPR) repeat protein
MKKKPARAVKPDFHTTPFSKLIELDKSLAEIRRQCAALSPEERRNAADNAYHASSATEIFNRVVAQTGAERPFREDWPSGIEALAIDPTYAPALLTVGSMEYQLGRKSEAMAMFEALLRLSKDEPDLAEIIDKAATFLVHEGDSESDSDDSVE